jgi:hypothetical protein
MAGVLAKSQSESVSMKKQSVVSALLQTTVPETSNSRESQLSPYKQTSLVLDQVLLRFPGHNVPSTARRSASVMRSCWRSSSPVSRNRLSPLASKKIGARVGRRPSASCFPSAVFISGSSRTFFSSYKVDTEAIAVKVKQEFTAKDKAKKAVKTDGAKQTVKGKRAA